MNTQYTMNQAIPLREYLKNRVAVLAYFEVVEQIIRMLIKARGEGFTFALDLDAMCINNSKIQLQMTAEDSVYEMAYVRNFLKELTFATVFAANENCASVTEYMRFLDDTRRAVSLEVILSFMGMHGTVQYQTMPSGQLQQGQQPHYQAMPSGQLQQPEDGETGVLGAGFWQNLEAKYQGSEPADGETGVLEPGFWETALMNTPSNRLDGGMSKQVYGKLIHVKTGQQTLISNDNFWIGKDGVDLQINKEVISRRHAVIICKANHYFVSDNDSTNKTYVNNKEIPPKASVEIFDGTRLKFANEEYEFRV